VAELRAPTVTGRELVRRIASIRCEALGVSPFVSLTGAAPG
jgi:hypothetical protein